MGIEAEQTQEENIDLEQIVANESLEQENIKQDEAPQLSDAEQKAFDQGWRPLDEFSGPEDNWKTAKEYVRDGEWIDKLNNLKGQFDNQQKQFDERLDNSNKLHEARRQSEIKTLKAEQRDAVLDSDTDKYDSTQKQIEELESQPAEAKTTEPQKDTAISEWETKNPWINDNNDERTPVTQAIWNSYLQQNPAATTQQAIAHVDDRLSKLYPTNNNNPRRDQPNTTENNKRPARRQSKSLTMNDLTSSERQEWNQFGSIMFTEEQFLKTVLDTRTK